MSATEFGVDQRGVALLEDPIANKSTAFDAGERRALGLDGLLPPTVETLGQQALSVTSAGGHTGCPPAAVTSVNARPRSSTPVAQWPYPRTSAASRGSPAS